MLARDEPTIANAEDDADSVVAIAGETDRIGVTTPDDFHRLRLLELIQPFERVPQLRRALIVLHVARLLHPLTQPGAHLERLPRQKQKDVVDHAPVVLDGLIADAGRLAAIDVIVEARPVRSFFGQVPGAGPHRENATDDLQ